MRHLLRFLSISIVVLLMFGSCLHNTYLQNNVNVPFIEDENEFQISGSTNIRKSQLQGVYAYDSSHFVFANGLYGHYDHLIREGQGYQESYLLESGIGLYRYNKRSHFELLGGLGYVRNQGNNKQIRTKAVLGSIYDIDCVSNYGKIFTQVNYGWSFKYFKIGFGVRASFIYYPKYKYDVLLYSDYDLYEVFEDASFRYKNVYGVVMDPFIHFERNRRRKLRLYVNAGYSLDYYNKLGGDTPGYDESLKDFHGSRPKKHPKYHRHFFNIGLKYVIGGRKSKTTD